MEHRIFLLYLLLFLPPLAAPSMPNANSSVPGFSVSKPELFDGDPEKCSGFLLQCSVFFSNSPPTTDKAKIGFIISRLSGKALEWLHYLEKPFLGLVTLTFGYFPLSF
uniref:DUF4939 domain-containing protein n=1 Tax=Astyanax mexicanus TaxID=7994 RepID=A0A3B1JCV1_ASTMX